MFPVYPAWKRQAQRQATASSAFPATESRQSWPILPRLFVAAKLHAPRRSKPFKMSPFARRFCVRAKWARSLRLSGSCDYAVSLMFNGGRAYNGVAMQRPGVLPTRQTSLFTVGGED